jgi:hypothetical protein
MIAEGIGESKQVRETSYCGIVDGNVGFKPACHASLLQGHEVTTTEVGVGGGNSEVLKLAPSQTMLAQEGAIRDLGAGR